ncbi:7222_t:CDS:2 [Cetraspora pellucida]|uniref:7222_t:CDS:1 n=1 Tax=Cetraspora pellucida TaxID=1433469 RepID=A0A9N9GR60_9GLOM|nr:7222_t:CDS:2 [Cetraspora pellucida]
MIDFEQAILNANINQFSVDDDNDVVQKELFEIEGTLDLSNTSFLPEMSKQTKVDIDVNVLEPGSSNWLEEFNQEEDYDPAELGEITGLGFQNQFRFRKNHGFGINLGF